MCARSSLNNTESEWGRQEKRRGGPGRAGPGRTGRTNAPLAWRSAAALHWKVVRPIRYFHWKAERLQGYAAPITSPSRMSTGRIVFALILILLPASKSLPNSSVENGPEDVKYDVAGGDIILSNTARDDERAVRRACQCIDGLCGCCTGIIMQNFVNYTPRQRGCLNITYDPDDFAFAMAVSMNDRVLYKNTISGKNPRPLCVPLPRVQSAKLCVRLSNVYFVGRNLHACIDMEARWQNQQTFQMSFDCIRIGADGVKVLKPEDGAGIAVGVPVNVTPSPDEYDEIPAEQPPEDEEVEEGQTQKPVRNKPSKSGNSTAEISKPIVELSTNATMSTTSLQ